MLASNANATQVTTSSHRRLIVGRPAPYRDYDTANEARVEVAPITDKTPLVTYLNRVIPAV